jgi:gas vesicle protein
MDASRFDAWTRRRFGLVAGGSIASLAGLSLLADADAKKKKKKKKCRKSLQPCGGKKKKCCKNLTCSDTLTADSVCCKPTAGTCTDQSECCGDTICDDIDGLEGTRCCFVADKPCTEKEDCCGDLVCISSTCASPL